LSPSSVKSTYGILRGIWRTAKAWGKVAHDPFPKGGIELPDIAPTKRQAFTPEEIQRMIEAAAEPDKTLFWLLAEIGPRIGEVLALKVEDIDFANGLVVIDENFVVGQLGTPKTVNGYRNPVLSQELAAHLHQRYGGASGYLFPGRNGLPIGYASTLERLHRLLDRLGIERRGFHCFRYANGTQAVAAGADVKTLHIRLGHADPGLTLRLYARKVSAGERALAAKLGAVFAPKLHPTPVA